MNNVFKILRDNLPAESKYKVLMPNMDECCVMTKDELYNNAVDFEANGVYFFKKEIKIPTPLGLIEVKEIV